MGLGTPAQVGVVTPLKWWFKSQPQALPIPTPAPPAGAPGPSPSDEPAAAAPVRPAAAPASNGGPGSRGEGGMGSPQNQRDALSKTTGAGDVDNFGTFARDVAMAPTGPIGAAMMMGRLALSGLRTTSVGPFQVSGPPGATDDNSNQIPGVQDAQQKAIAAGVPAGAVAQMGADALRNMQAQRKKQLTAGAGGSGGGGSGSGNGGYSVGTRNSVTGQLGHV